MEKISSILPSNARIKSVDMKTSHAARPGAPAFGRMMGRTSSEDRVSFSDMDSMSENLNAGYNPKEARQVKIAEDITNKFFENRLKPVAGEELDQMVEVPTPAIVATAAPVIDREAVRTPVAAATPGESPAREGGLDVYA